MSCVLQNDYDKLLTGNNIGLLRKKVVEVLHG